MNFASSSDLAFKTTFEALAVAPVEFRHRSHLRLAYVYLCEGTVDEAYVRLQASLLAYLDHLGAPREKYHATLTKAWLLAVRHFMVRGGPFVSFDQFIVYAAKLLDASVMRTHYSAVRMASALARLEFVEPDLDPIPRHEPSAA